jgi:hypothetical protein
MTQEFAITDIVVMNIYRENCVTPDAVPWNVVDANVKFILDRIPDGKARYAQIHDGLMAKWKGINVNYWCNANWKNAMPTITKMIRLREPPPGPLRGRPLEE